MASLKVDHVLQGPTPERLERDFEYLGADSLTGCGIDTQNKN